MLVVSFSSKLWAGEQAPAQLQWSDWEKVAAAQHSGDKTTVLRWTHERYDHLQQLQYEENRYEVTLDGFSYTRSCTPARLPGPMSRHGLPHLCWRGLAQCHQNKVGGKLANGAIA